MSKKETITLFAIIFIIFSIGFFLRIESANISGVPDNEKAFYQDQNGLPYMYELDSYYNYRLTKNYLEHGYFGDVIINGTQWDLHSYYPPGRSAEYPPLLAYLAVLFYKLSNLFINIPLLVVCFWLPAFIAPLAGIVAYLFVRRFTNGYGAAAAGILTVTVPFYFVRTVPGWFDTDMFNILFPLLIIWSIAEAVNAKDNKRVLFAFLAAFFMFLFSIAWEGWTYVFYIIVLSFLIYILLYKLIRFKVKNVLQVSGLFIALTILFIIIPDISNISSFIAPFQFIQANTSLWPGIYLSVGEMGHASFEDVVSGLGFSFFAGILGIIWIFRIMINNKLKKSYLNKFTWFLFIILVFWAIIGFLAIMQGERFLMILIPPFVISSGVMVGICAGYFYRLKENTKFNVPHRKQFIKLISIGIVLLVTFTGILNDYNTLPAFVPGANDDLWDVSQWISNNTSSDTVIISDWSYGHLFSLATKRYVSIDGGSQNSPRTYWIYKAFETDNESLSLGIFKMIATNGDMGYLTLDNYTKNTTKTVEILNNTLGLSKDEAMTVMTKKYGLSILEAQTVLNYTHPDNPRPFVLVTTNGMINKGYWTFYFGSWDFNLLKGNDLTYTFGNTSINGDTLNSTNGISMNLNTGHVIWNKRVPYSVIISDKGKVKQYYIDKNSDFSVIIDMDFNKSVLIDKGYENSLFTQLVIEKSDLTNFKAIYKNNNAVVWKSRY